MQTRVVKIVGQIIVADFDENGDIVAERAVADITIYRPHFDRLAESVAEVFPEPEQPDAL